MKQTTSISRQLHTSGPKRCLITSINVNINSNMQPIVKAKQLDLSALQSCNDFMMNFGSILSKHLFNGYICDVPSQDCGRLDSLLHLVASEALDRQKQYYCPIFGLMNAFDRISKVKSR
uniref:Uncharacterized protein n=1 Tax=Schistocephalus solidus TaxID=70667 RepID=A0A0X3Q0T2_SCHSO